MAISSIMADIPESKVSPNFLHGNSTSHTWIFSAIAELIDNAYDPDVAATQIKIDCGNIGGKETLEFIDNGFGMDTDKLHKMLSLGFSDKPAIKGHIPIGQYGNGFKSGSMRLAKDVMVFTVHSSTVSAGFLSQTYLQTISAETVIVPIVTWSLPTYEMIDTPQYKNSLHAILTYSTFNSEQLLLQQFKDIVTNGARGTKIILYNLKQNRYGNYELDFHSDANDILNPETQTLDRSTMERPLIDTSPTYRKSLREYLSILFLKPLMKIILRSVKVKTKLVSKSLSKTEKDFYKPHWIDKAIPVIFGFTQQKDTVDYGVLLYNRNRLIKAYEKVGYQKQPNELGVGVVGVVDVGFLQPIHNKTDFNKDDRYNAFINALSTKLNEYWNEKMNTTDDVPAEQTGGKKADWLWAQCDRCLKWRRLMDRTDNDLPDKWYCYMNTDATHNQCSISEEPEDEDDVLCQPSYVKTFKKHQDAKKKQIRNEEIRASEEREKTIRQREELVQKNMQVLKEASSSKMSQRASLEKARIALEAAKRHSAYQNNIIKELSKPKEVIAKNQRDLLRITEKVAITHSEQQSDGGCDAVAELAGDVPNTMVRPKAASSRKRHIIDTEDGQIIVETASSSESTASTPKKSMRHKSAPADSDATEEGAAFVDLTLNGNDDDKGDVIKDTSVNCDADVKPDIEKLNEELAAESAVVAVAITPTPTTTDPTDSIDTATTSTAIPASFTFTSKRFIKRGVQCSVDMISEYSQTDTVLPDGTTVSVKVEDEGSKTSDLKKQLRDRTAELEELRKNVRSLLEQIVPDANMNSIESIDQVVSEMLRIADNDSSQ